MFRGGLLSYTYDSAVAIIMSNVIKCDDVKGSTDGSVVELVSGISENIRMFVLQPWLDVGCENAMLNTQF